MSERRQVLQAIVTKRIPPTNTKGERIKAIASAGSITVSASKVNGDDGRDAIETQDNQHRAVARMLMHKFGWDETGWQIETGRLPNGDYVHVMI